MQLEEVLVPLMPARYRARAPGHLVLVGPSGVGKSTVAPLVARALGLAHKDLDTEIETRAQSSVGELFAQGGEARFRRLELAALEQLLAHEEPLVIAAGGGTFAQPEAQAQLLAQARVVGLTAPTQVLAARLIADSHHAVRPLVGTSDPLGALTRLVESRRDAHRRCHVEVDTHRREPAAVCKHIVDELLRERPDTLHAWHGAARYPVALSPSGPQATAELVRAVGRPRAVALVADTDVLRLFGAAYTARLEALGVRVIPYGFAAGDASKSFETLHHLLETWGHAGLTRADAVIGLGGGVSLDLAGFAAAIYQRGLPFIAVPTTLLAAVDASVGGKSGINMAWGKNQLGAIRAPHGVVVDLSALSQQDAPGFLCGLVEALKMGALFDAGLMARVPSTAQTPEAIAQVVFDAVALKMAVCRIDPNDRGQRATLNYGHTVGHAIERGEAYRMPHGTAVGLGMVAEAEWAEAAGWAHNVAAPLREALTAMNMPTDWRRANLEPQAIRHDKKGDGTSLMMPIVERPGSTRLYRVDAAHLEAFLRRS